MLPINGDIMKEQVQTNDEISEQVKNKVLSARRNLSLRRFRYPRTRQAKRISQETQILSQTLQSLGVLTYVIQSKIHTTIGVIIQQNCLFSYLPSEHVQHLTQIRKTIHFVSVIEKEKSFTVDSIECFSTQVDSAHLFYLFIVKFKTVSPLKDYMGYSFTPFPTKKKVFAFKHGQTKKYSLIQVTILQSIVNTIIYDSNDLLQIGSPLFVLVESEFILIGFHYGKRQQKSFGVLLNQQLMNKINLSLFETTDKVMLNWSNKVLKRLDIQGLHFLTHLDFDNLSIVQLSENRLGTKGINILVRANWPNISSLLLCGNLINDEGANLLRKGKWLKLYSLNLMNNQISDKGMQFLLKGHWRSLFYLCLYKNHLTIKGSIKFMLGDWTILGLVSIQKNHLQKYNKHILYDLFQAKFINLDRVTI